MNTTGWFRLVVLAAAGVVFAAPCLSAATAPATRPAGFKYVTVTTDLDENGLPKRIHRKEIYFIGDAAFCVDAEGLPDLVLDLKKQTASDEQGTRWSLADLQNRADHERQEARKRAEKIMDPAAAQRAKLETDPGFAVTEEGGKVVITNPLVRYEIQPAEVDQRYQKRLYPAIRLLTLAGASPASPPYVSLALTDELERRVIIAQDAKGVSKAGGKSSETRIQSRISPLSEEDQKRLATMLLPAGGF
jgi:hypothetical protein